MHSTKAVRCLGIATGLAVWLAGSPVAEAQQSSAQGDAERLVGIWRLLSITTDGRVNPIRGGRPTGYIFYTASGYMGAQIQPERAPVAKAGTEPSEAEAKAALVGYSAYWGAYKVDEKAKVITHIRYASVQPGTEVDAFRSYRFEGSDRIVLGGVGTGNQNTWERVAAEPAPTGDAAELVGMWKLEAISLNGKVHPLRGAKPSGFLFYTATGEMSAMIQPDRPLLQRAGAETSGPEAQAALKGFTAYFGTFTLDEKAKIVTHNRIANVQPGAGQEAKRSYQFLPFDRLVSGGLHSGQRLVWEKVR